MRSVVVPVSRGVAPQPGVAYRQIGVRLWGEGAYEREPVDGSATQYATLYEARSGDVIVNKIWARNGSVAVVDDCLSGAFGSGEFPMFAPTDALLPRWAHWLTKWRPFWEQCAEKSQGTSGQNRIKPEQFLDIAIPLPPLPEQQRIVAKIDEVATQLDAAQTLQATVSAEADVLCRALLRDAHSVATQLRELVSLRTPDVRVQADLSYHFAGVYSFGRGVFVGSTKAGTEFAYPKLTRLRAGNFVYPKLMAWEGAFGIVPPACDGLVVSTEFPVFEVNQARVLPEVLDVHFRNPALWASIGGASTGTNVRRRRLNPQDFLDLVLPLPSMARQRLLAKTCEEVQAMKARQLESRSMMHALLPAILDRAFSGAL